MVQNLWHKRKKHVKNHKIRSFLQNHKNPEAEIYAFCIISFESIEILTHSSPQNDRLNLSGVKDIYIDGGNLARNVRKTAICQSQILVQSLGQTQSISIYWLSSTYCTKNRAIFTPGVQDTFPDQVYESPNFSFSFFFGAN